MSEEAPTPWDVAKRMRAEGQPRQAIVERLTAMGVALDDINVLLLEDPPKGEGMEVSTAAAAVAVLAAGPILGGLAVAAMSDRVAEREEAGPQVKLAETDTTTNRCAVHKELASIGTCPRCGAFSCRECAPKEGFAKNRFCAKCESQPGVTEERVRGTARWVSAASFGFVFLLLATGLLGASEVESRQVPFLFVAIGAFSVPFIGLGVLQLFLRARWPAVCIGVYALGVLVLSVIGGMVHLITCLWVVLIGGVYATFLAMGTARERWKAAQPAKPAP